ncbi:MAG: multidrug effflux MFS transporter [Rhodospirillaceae bacterium]|nr:multidrug effflux MFS transporter [Rhodospirillaceae bacterium]
MDAHDPHAAAGHGDHTVAATSADPVHQAAPPSLVVSLVLTLLVAFGPLSTDLYLPALPTISTIFQVDSGSAQLTLSIFLLGFATGMLAYGPLSDRFGRRPLILGGIVVFVVASVGCALADSLDSLIVWRFFQAIGACCGPVLGRATVRDICAPEDAARVMAYMGLAMGVAPAAGPVLGGMLTEAFGWRSTFVVLTVFGLAVGAAVVVLLGETNRYKNPEATRLDRLIANYWVLLRHRVFVGYALVQAAGYSGIFAYISASSFVLIDGVGLSPLAFGLCFGAVVLGFMLGTFLSGRTVKRVGLDRLMRIGTSLSLAMAVILSVLAFTLPPSVPAVVGPMAGFMVGIGLTLPNAMAGALGPFPYMAGSASALMGFGQMGLAALIGFLVGQATDGTAHALGVALVAMSAIAAAAHGLVVSRARPAAGH